MHIYTMETHCDETQVGTGSLGKLEQQECPEFPEGSEDRALKWSVEA